MKFWPFSRNKKIESTKHEVKTLGLTESSGSFLIFGNNNASTPSSALNLYNKSSAVSIPINKIAEPFASIDPVLEINGEIVTDHPLLDLLNKPSPLYDSKYGFFETIGKHYLITGESIIVALGGIGRPPLELQPISPSNVSVTEGPGGFAANYDISGNTLAGSYGFDRRTFRYFNGRLRELKHIRGFSTKNNGILRGQSRLVSAASEARQHILGNNHNISLLEKGGRVSLVFHFDEDFTQDDFDATLENIRAQYGGADNAGKIGVTTGGGSLTVHELGKTNKDMDFAKLQQVATNAVALQYGVPLPLVSNTAATFNNFQNAVLLLFDNGVLPLTERIYSGLGAFLLPRYGLDPKKAKITYDVLSISALRQRILNELKTRKEINIESDNELRAFISREPYEGGDIIYKPSNISPVGVDVEQDGVPITRNEPEIIEEPDEQDER